MYTDKLSTLDFKGRQANANIDCIDVSPSAHITEVYEYLLYQYKLNKNDHPLMYSLQRSIMCVLL